MDALKKFFPYSFGAKDTNALVVKIVVYIVAAILAGVVLALAGLLTGWIPVLGAIIGTLLSIVGWIVEVCWTTSRSLSKKHKKEEVRKHLLFYL